MKKAIKIVALLFILLCNPIFSAWGPTIPIDTCASTYYSTWLARDDNVGPIVFIAKFDAYPFCSLIAYWFGPSYSLRCDTLTDSIDISIPSTTVHFPKKRHSFETCPTTNRFAFSIGSYYFPKILLAEFNGDSFITKSVPISLPDSVANFTGQLFSYSVLSDNSNLILVQENGNSWLLWVRFSEDSVLGYGKILNIPYGGMYWTTENLELFSRNDSIFDIVAYKWGGPDNYTFKNSYNGSFAPLTTETIIPGTGRRFGSDIELAQSGVLYYDECNETADSLWFIKSTPGFNECLGFLTTDINFINPNYFVLNNTDDELKYIVTTGVTLIHGQYELKIAKAHSGSILCLGDSIFDNLRRPQTYPVFGLNDTLWFLNQGKDLGDGYPVSLIGWVEDSFITIHENAITQNQEVEIAFNNPIYGFPCNIMLKNCDRNTTINIYDLNGRVIFHDSGKRNYNWDGRCLNKIGLATGIYFIAVNNSSTNKIITTKKLIILKGAK